MDVLHGKNALNAISTPLNGRVPYYYGDSEEERGRATREIRSNPFPITEAGLAKGKELYAINCGICHGEKADGGGYLVRDANPAAGDPGGKYPAAPANLVLDTFLLASNGRFYHAIMYGKNAMGAYADKLSFEERWQVIHYIRSLQAESQKAVYNEQENSLNPEFGMPKAKLAKAAAPAKDDAPQAGPGK
jgi:mono/diheme cytochrome c family protein